MELLRPYVPQKKLLCEYRTFSISFETLSSPNLFCFRPNRIVSGDILVLTKPLGTQLATNVYHWMMDSSDSWMQLQTCGVTEDDVVKTYLSAIESMGRLNKTAAELMHKYNAHGATDVTGFGLKGHTENLLAFQGNQLLSFHIHTLPILQNVHRFATLLKRTEKLMTGKAVETSGGLLVSLPGSLAAKGYCEDYKAMTKTDCWIIGKVENDGQNKVVIAENVKVINVD